MWSPQVILKGLISRLLQGRPIPDGPEAERAVRMGPWGDLKVESAFPDRKLLADEGAYMVAGMLPGAIALQIGIMATYTALSAAFVMVNTDGPGGKKIFLDYLRLRLLTVGTSDTDLQYSVVLDSINRAPTTVALVGAPANLTAYKPIPVCTNMDINPQIVGVPFFPLSTAGGTPPTVPAPSAYARTIVGNGRIRSLIPITKDDYMLTFGGVGESDNLAGVVGTQCKIVVSNPPIVIGPGQCALINLWSTGNITAGNAFDGAEMGWIER